MNKILKLNSYSQYDELGDRDYMVYEVEYDNGHKEYVSRDTFRNLKALESVIAKDFIDFKLLKKCKTHYEYNRQVAIRYDSRGLDIGLLTEEEFDLLKEVLL